ncbi:unnamed protein product [Soboliphyme baturini]|uniref:Globin domain-containing protein n=1 Tax=Soboliphyme baturini TaxID=241478 RepID=A0A3P8BA05_9BILA|nr:unnamed protein product [Soboliphyme baturini]
MKPQNGCRPFIAQTSPAASSTAKSACSRSPTPTIFIINSSDFAHQGLNKSSPDRYSFMGNQQTGSHRSLQESMRQRPLTMEDETQKVTVILSNYQKTLLRDSWLRINKTGIRNIGTMIFRRLLTKQRSIKQLFQHITVLEGVFSAGLTPIQAYQHHSLLFVELIDNAIKNIDDLSVLIPTWIEHGAKHARFKAYGFEIEYWDMFGSTMTEAAREWEGWRRHRETIRSWTLLISFIVDRLRQGYEMEMHVLIKRATAHKFTLSFSICFRKNSAKCCFKLLYPEIIQIHHHNTITLMAVSPHNSPFKC